MKKQLFAAAIVLTACVVVPMRAEVIEQILVKVNGDIITKTELEGRQVAALRQRMQGKQVDPESLKNDEGLKKALAMTPDLICVLDAVSGEAVGSETIRYGQRVTVIALPPPAIFLTPKGLEHVGPRAFGYDLDFKSVFA